VSATPRVAVIESREFGRAAYPERITKRCTGPCGLDKRVGEFYSHHTSAISGNVILFGICKSCLIKVNLERKRRIRPPLSRTIFNANNRGFWMAVRLQEPVFVPPPIVEPSFPPWGSTPLCSRGDHEWPIETLCRGYEALGCEGAEPHVHRACLVHSCETIEQAPWPLRRRT
jgi:hypothetical protein